MLKFLLSKKLVLIAMSFDFSTSIGGRELNPVLTWGNFGARQVAIGTAITLIPLLLEKKYGDIKGVNPTLTGIHVAAGISNMVQKGKH